MGDLAEFVDVSSRDNGLCVLSTLHPEGDIHSTVVNAGVIDDPTSGESVVALIADARSRKVQNLHASPRVTVAARAGWNWTTVEGRAELVTADREPPGLPAEKFRALLRAVSAAAIGGAPDDWRGHVDALALDDHVVVLITPLRIYSGSP